MGRPLAKRFFGNRNIGTAATTDDGIGGEGVASAAVTVAGSYTTLRPTFTFTAPTIVGGVTALGTVTSEVLSATISGGTGYGNAQTFDLTVNTAGGTAILNVTSDAGGAIVTVNSYTSRGSFEAISAVTSISGGLGNNDAVPVLTYRGKSIIITNSGSGYAAAPTIAGYVNRGGITVNTIVLTTDSGPVGSSTNQENAILAYAYVTANSLPADIQAQKGSHRYLVATSEGSAVCKLVAATPAAVGEMTITATDSAACTYYVTKLTAHRAVLVPFGGGSYVFPVTGTNADGSSIYQSVKWAFATTDAWYDAATTVVIANA